MLGAADVSAAMRGEAARGLGQLGTPAARDALVAAFPGEEDTDVATQIVESLGRFPFPKVAAAFEDILSEPAAEQDVRIAAVEALAASNREGQGYRPVRVAEREVGKWQGRFTASERERIAATLAAFGVSAD